jgi:hypothetical protein
MAGAAAVLRNGSDPLDFLPHRGNLGVEEAAVPDLSPTTPTADEQRLILRATAGNLRDHLILSLALGTGGRLSEPRTRVPQGGVEREFAARAGSCEGVGLEQGRALGSYRQVELSRYFKRLTMCHP